MITSMKKFSRVNRIVTHKNRRIDLKKQRDSRQNQSSDRTVTKVTKLTEKHLEFGSERKEV